VIRTVRGSDDRPKGPARARDGGCVFENYYGYTSSCIAARGCASCKSLACISLINPAAKQSPKRSSKRQRRIETLEVADENTGSSRYPIVKQDQVTSGLSMRSDAAVIELTNVNIDHLAG